VEDKLLITLELETLMVFRSLIRLASVLMWNLKISDPDSFQVAKISLETIMFLSAQERLSVLDHRFFSFPLLEFLSVK
jgi:hypothetical protein